MFRKIYKYDEAEIIKYLNEGKNVYIEYGSLVDKITGHTKGEKYDNDFWDDGIRFITEGKYFGEEVTLYAFGEVKCEEFNGALIVNISFL